MKKKRLLVSLAFTLVLLLCGCQASDNTVGNHPSAAANTEQSAYTLQTIPEYSGTPYVELNGNVPDFSEDAYTTDPFETYSELDALGRCQSAYANICQEIMPTEKRGKIGMVKPTGWHTVKYDGVDGKYLYNRAHLIGFQLAGENANEKNLITGTRYFNVEGMLPFEDQVAEYVHRTDHHVLYRVTPVYEGDNLVASGVTMEAASVEDEEIRFHVYVYNVQPGIEIDYATGESWEGAKPENQEGASSNTYVINTNTRKFHRPDCSSVADTKQKNRKETKDDRETLIQQGYSPCSRCNP